MSKLNVLVIINNFESIEYLTDLTLLDNIQLTVFNPKDNPERPPHLLLDGDCKLLEFVEPAEVILIDEDFYTEGGVKFASCQGGNYAKAVKTRFPSKKTIYIGPTNQPVFDNGDWDFIASQQTPQPVEVICGVFSQFQAE